MGKAHPLWSPSFTWFGLIADASGRHRKGVTFWRLMGYSRNTGSTSPGICQLETQRPFPPVCSLGRKGQSPNEEQAWDEKDGMRGQSCSFLTQKAGNLQIPVSHIPILIPNTLQKREGKAKQGQEQPHATPEVEWKTADIPIQDTMRYMFYYDPAGAVLFLGTKNILSLYCIYKFTFTTALLPDKKSKKCYKWLYG